MPCSHPSLVCSERNYSTRNHLKITGCKVQACVLSLFSHIQLFTTLWTVAHQAPLSMIFSRREYWNRLPCHPPGHLPDPGIEPTSFMSPALAAGFFTTRATCGPLTILPQQVNPSTSKRFWNCFVKYCTHKVLLLMELAF